MNCWEHMNCDESLRKTCPAFVNDKGTKCWEIANTVCMGGLVSKATVIEKLAECSECSYYRHMKAQKENIIKSVLP